MTNFLDQPGDGRTQPEIPAATLSWALLLGAILRLGSANRLEWLANFTGRVGPEVIRHRSTATLKLAKYNKVFEETVFIGLAIDGTGTGRTTKEACSLCHPIRDSKDNVTGHNHHFVMVSVVGTGITLPFDVEPYKPGDSEYAAGKRLLKRAVSHPGPRFANYVAADAKFAAAPFLHTSDQVGLPLIARLKQNLPELESGGRSPLQPAAADGHVSVWRRLD